MKKLNLSLYLLFAAACALTASCSGGGGTAGYGMAGGDTYGGSGTGSSRLISLKILMPSSSGRSAIASRDSTLSLSGATFSAHLLSDDGSYDEGATTEFGNGDSATLTFEEVEVGLELRAVVEVYEEFEGCVSRLQGVSDLFTVSPDGNEVTVNLEWGPGVMVNPITLDIYDDSISEINYSTAGVWSSKLDGTYNWYFTQYDPETGGDIKIPLPYTSSSFNLPVGDLSYYVPDAAARGGVGVSYEWHSSLGAEWLHEEGSGYLNIMH